MDTPRPHASTEPCRVCGGPLLESFEGELLGHVSVCYGQCAQCHSLLLPEPTWLEEAYGKVIVPDPDFGALKRTLFIHRCLRRMRNGALGLLPKRSRSLDYGSGRGLLLRLLLDDGQDAWGYDPYPRAIFGEDRITNRLPSGPFELITAIEVLEHTLDPLDTLQALGDRLAPKGVLVLSTELYDARTHGPEWAYLAQEHGQHITLFSRSGLRRAAETAGLDWIGSLPWGGQPFLHLLVPKGRKVSAFGLWWLQQRHRRGERRARKDRWA